MSVAVKLPLVPYKPLTVPVPLPQLEPYPRNSRPELQVIAQEALPPAETVWLAGLTLPPDPLHVTVGFGL
jgi:hypothetical protein